MSRVNFRTDENLKQEFKRFCDARGKSMSDELNTMMEKAVGRSSNRNLPDDDTLSKAYQTLYWMGQTNLVQYEDAESTVANALNIQKSSARSRIIVPLRQRGYITKLQQIHDTYYRMNVDIGDSINSPREESVPIDEIEREADGQLEKLASAKPEVPADD